MIRPTASKCAPRAWSCCGAVWMSRNRRSNAVSRKIALVPAAYTSPALRGLGPRSGPTRGARCDAGEGGVAGSTLTLGASRLDLSRQVRERCTSLVEHLRNNPQHDPAHRLEMRAAGLDLLRCRMDVAEPPLERGVEEDRARPRLLVGEVGNLGRGVDGVRAGQPHAGPRRER